MTAPENNNLDFVNFSNYLNLIKFTLFSNDKISEKFKEYANIMVSIPINLQLTDLNYFQEHQIDTNHLIQLLANNIKHVDTSIPFKISRGFMALFPNRNLEEAVQLEDMSRRSKIPEFQKNSHQLLFIECFYLAEYLKSWVWHGKGIEYTNNIYYDYQNKQLYASHLDKSIRLVKLEKTQFKLENTLAYLINAFNTTINYRESLLATELLFIPFSGMHEALILNKNVIEGYRYNKFNEMVQDILTSYYKILIYQVRTHFSINNKPITEIGIKISENILTTIDFTPCKNQYISELVNQVFTIFLGHDRSPTEMLDEFIEGFLQEENDLVILHLLANHPAFTTHNLEILFTKACNKGLDRVVRTLLTFSKSHNNVINHNINSNYGFFWACQKGNINLAKYLYSLGNVNVNNTYNGSAFNIACVENHLEVAKWLHSLGNIELHSGLSEGFILSCLRNHENVYRWMWSIAENKEQYFIDWKTSGRMINEYETYYKLFH